MDEMETFIRDKNGKPVHRPGKHDDLLFALMIALQVHQRCPLSDLPYRDDYTGELVAPEKQESLSTIGAIDDCIFDEEEE